MIEYSPDDIARASGFWKKMRIRGVPIEQVATEDLAIAAVAARWPTTRLAAVAELVSRIKNDQAARQALSKVPRKREANKTADESAQCVLTDPK